MTQRTFKQVDEFQLQRLAQLVALKIRAGDTIALHGDLGAGKTTFARCLIRAVLGDAHAEIPSPTFALVQTYEAPRLELAHIDLYRLSHEDEARELGAEELAARGALIIEWPERAPSLLGANRLEISLSECLDADHRDLVIDALGTWVARFQRIDEIADFLDDTLQAERANIAYLQGDASARAYARLTGTKRPLILMDWPSQPDGPPVKGGFHYSRIAHLADGTAAFENVDRLLASAGLVVPRIHAADHEHGLMLIGDLGDRVFGAEVAAGRPLEPMWTAATDVLVELRALDAPRVAAWNEVESRAAPIRDYDRGAYEIEIALLPDWYWPLVKGGAIPEAARAAFAAAWAQVLDRILRTPDRCLTLRDYHSPNLLWLPERRGHPAQQVGLIDFQDALIGHPAFDLVSLLQDARLDVPAALEDQLYEHYVGAVRAIEPGFDEAAFRFAYAALGAQRNTKILGIFSRLWKRDGKAQYLRHIPRLWRYLERNLSHPELASLAHWYAFHFPLDIRTTLPAA